MNGGDVGRSRSFKTIVLSVLLSSLASASVVWLVVSPQSGVRFSDHVVLPMSKEGCRRCPAKDCSTKSNLDAGTSRLSGQSFEKEEEVEQKNCPACPECEVCDCKPSDPGTIVGKMVDQDTDSSDLRDMSDKKKDETVCYTFIHLLVLLPITYRRIFVQ